MTPAHPSHKDKWLAVLDHYGVGRPESLEVVEFPLACVQATAGEPPGTVVLEPMNRHVLVVNMSHKQRMRQVRDGRSFHGEMLRGEMSLMPQGMSSQWGWEHTCNRLALIVCPKIPAPDSHFATP